MPAKAPDRGDPNNPIVIDQNGWRVEVILNETDDGGTIASNLRSFLIGGNSNEYETTNADADKLVDGMESLILAHVCAGVDITTDAYKTGLDVALEACANNL